MNKKRIILSLLILAFIAVGGYSIYNYFVSSASNKFLTKTAADIKDNNFLKDKQAVLYFSTVGNQDISRGYAVFIDKNGNATNFKLNGLELGTIASSKQQVMLDDQKNIYLTGTNYKEFQFDNNPETINVTAGYLPNNDIFYSIYNTGTDGTDTYQSDIRWGNDKGFKKDSLPAHIETYGQVKNDIYILTSDLSKNDTYSLEQVNLSEKVTKKTITSWGKTENTAPMSQIIADENYYYVVVNGDPSFYHTELLKINKQTSSIQRFSLATYPEDENEFIKTIPFRRKTSYIYKDNLYYADGLGDVYKFNLKDDKVSKAFSFKDYQPADVSLQENVTYKDNYVYFFRFNMTDKKYTIEKYNLLTGNMEHKTSISGIEELLNIARKEGLGLSAYDFKILD